MGNGIDGRYPESLAIVLKAKEISKNAHLCLLSAYKFVLLTEFIKLRIFY